MNAITLLLASNRLNKKKRGGVTNARGTDLPFTSIEFSRGCLLSRVASYDPPTGLRHDSSRIVFNKFIDYRLSSRNEFRVQLQLAKFDNGVLLKFPVYLKHCTIMNGKFTSISISRCMVTSTILTHRISIIRRIDARRPALPTE